jgi:hypothetical protein
MGRVTVYSRGNLRIVRRRRKKRIYPATWGVSVLQKPGNKPWELAPAASFLPSTARGSLNFLQFRADLCFSHPRPPHTAAALGSQPPGEVATLALNPSVIAFRETPCVAIARRLAAHQGQRTAPRRRASFADTSAPLCRFSRDPASACVGQPPRLATAMDAKPFIQLDESFRQAM